MCVCDGQTERTEFFRHRVMLQTTDVQEDDTIQERAFNTEVRVIQSLYVSQSCIQVMAARTPR